MARRAYVKVKVHFDFDGNLTPVEITWEDGTVYEIDRILDVRQAASESAGSLGIRYTCRILNHETYLYYENPKWFVEAKNLY